MSGFYFNLYHFFLLESLKNYFVFYPCCYIDSDNLTHYYMIENIQGPLNIAEKFKDETKNQEAKVKRGFFKGKK